MSILCLVPPELAPKLLEPLRSHYADAGVEVEVLEEHRSRERRSGTQRRRKDKGPPEGVEERRRIRNEDGRRAGERRAELVPIDPPAELPRKARPFADQISFYERVPLSEEQAEDLDTARLVTRIQANGREEFAALYGRYFDRVYGYLRVALRDPHGAEDAAQQVFIQVFEKLPEYERRDRPFRAWLFTIARNTALMDLRRKGKLDLQDPADLDRVRETSGENGESLEALAWISDSDLMLFIERLPESQRQALFLRYMLGMSASEIGEVLGRSANDVSQLQSRALRFLRERLKAIGRRGPHGERIRTRRRVIQAWVLRSRRYALRH